jgi:5-methyltetrahydropteroyltriglutamate--homocysteine methyltransferase
MEDLCLETLIDDVGSFPLPSNVEKEKFDEAYRLARKGLVDGKNIFEDDFVREHFIEVTLNSFKRKISTGLDAVNYPQQYEGMKQVGDVVHSAMGTGTFVVPEDQSFLPEVRVIDESAKSLWEETGQKILLRVSLFGPMELYLKEIGTVFYRDVLEGFAETIRRFAKNSILDQKYVKTVAVSIDEPSFGFHDINASRDDVAGVLEKAFDFKGVAKQIHLHSSTRLPDLLNVNNIDVLSFEYGASPKNIEGISKAMLEKTGKHIRVGISRTDIDAITAELFEKGVTRPTSEQLVEEEDVIRKRFLLAKVKFDESMTFTGPDCGLGSWPTQEAAELLLRRTVKAVKSALEN